MYFKWKWMGIGIVCCFCFFNDPGLHHNNFMFYDPHVAYAADKAITSSLQPLVVALHFGLEAMKLGNAQEVSSARVIPQSEINTLNEAVASFLRASMAYPPIVSCLPPPKMPDGIDILTGTPIPLPTCPSQFGREEDQSSDAEVATSGSANFRRVNDDFTLTLNNFEILTTHITDGSVRKDILNLTITGTIEHTTLCREQEIASSVTAKIDGDFLKRIDENADTIWEQDIQGHYEHFVLDVRASDFEPTSCMPTTFVVSASGKFDFMDAIKTGNAFAIDIQKDAPAVLTWETVGNSVYILVDGSFNLTSSCFTGELALNTNEILIFPSLETDGEVADCPISGSIVITNDRETTITFTSNGGVDIDTDGDGLVDMHFENCHDIQICL